MEKRFRLKVILVLMTIIISVISANFFFGLSVMSQSIRDTSRGELVLVTELADALVSTHLKALQDAAESAAESVAPVTEPAEIKEKLLHVIDRSETITSLSVLSRGGVLASSGSSSMLRDGISEGEMQRAFSGNAFFTSTSIHPVSGRLVIYYLTSVNQEHILAATIPGMYFSDLLSRFRMWDSGNIYMTDETGVLIANYRDNLVQERVNFIQTGKVNPGHREAAKYTRKMISHPYGFGTYKFEGKKRTSAFKRVTGSGNGWVLAAVAPYNEGPPLNYTRILIIGDIFLLLVGMAAIFIGARYVIRLFRQMQAQNQHLKEQNQAVATASESKTNFLAGISHEMRTPMNAIIGLSELTLNRSDLKDEMRRNVEGIHNAGATLLSIVNDLLDISKMESGKYDLHEVRYDVASLINDVIVLNILRIGEKPVTFHLEADPNLPAALQGDDLRVKQIFNNLLSNAFKYTRAGHVTWEIHAEREGDLIWLISTVRDTGIGIREKDLNNLFAKYSKVDAQANRNIEGTGLGLALTQNLVSLMEGTITVESEFGKGSAFTIRVKQGFVSDASLGKEIADGLKGFRFADKRRNKNSKLVYIPLSYARVLVVDDVQANLDVAKGMMKPYGMTIDCVSGGMAAIEAIRLEKHRYNAIFMDHMMPEIDGIEATRMIREIDTDYARAIPIIALTANAIIGNEEMFLSRGFQAFLSKPIDMMRLDSVIRQWVRDRDLEKRMEGGKDWRAGKPGKSDGDPGDAGDANAGAQNNQPEKTDSPGKKDDDRAMEPSRNTADTSADGHIADRGSDGSSGDGSDGEDPGDCRSAVGPPRREKNSLLFEGRDIPGISLQDALDRFGGNEEILFEVLQSFAVNTRPLLDTVRTPSRESLGEYAVTVHGVKGSSRGICAELLGSCAEELEHAARSGDLDFILKKNQAFIVEAERLLDNLSAMLSSIDGSSEKNVLPCPDASLLRRLQSYCAAFDMDGVDAVMDELESFTYLDQPELIPWLREQVDRMEFREIISRLGNL